MAFMERVPLEVVIADKNLMKPLWDQLSVPQQVIVKALYGLPLAGQAERKAWAVLNGHCKVDELGFVTEWWECEYSQREYQELIALIGRRSGKSYLTCFIALYEIIFGGHGLYVEPDQEYIVPYIAQDLPTARVNMKMIRILANKVPMLKNQLAAVDKPNPNYIKFKNGLTVQIEPPRVKTGRGWAMPLIIMDEVGFWPTDDEAADQDIEVLRAVIPATLQFPHKKILIISSPYTETGILWEYARAGTEGRLLAHDDVEKPQYAESLVLQCPTAAMENPALVKAGIKRELTKEQARDPEGFIREYLARFVKSESSFILGEHVDACTKRGRKELTLADINNMGEIPSVVAVMDPAFRNDDFAFAIFHTNKYGKVIMDFLKIWSPDKKNRVALNPDDVIFEISQILKKWNISVVYSDQYQFEALQQLALKYNFVVIKHDFTATSKSKLYGSLNNMLRAGMIELLDYQIIYQQLTRLVMKKTALGTVQISAPQGEHDDVATVVALGSHVAIQLRPQLVVNKPREKTLFEQGVECITRKRVAAQQEESWH